MPADGSLQEGKFRPDVPSRFVAPPVEPAPPPLTDKDATSLEALKVSRAIAIAQGNEVEVARLQGQINQTVDTHGLSIEHLLPETPGGVILADSPQNRSGGKIGVFSGNLLDEPERVLNADPNTREGLKILAENNLATDMVNPEKIAARKQYLIEHPEARVEVDVLELENILPIEEFKCSPTSSVARGEAVRGSDLDGALVVGKSTKKQQLEFVRELRRQGFAAFHPSEAADIQEEYENALKRTDISDAGRSRLRELAIAASTQQVRFETRQALEQRLNSGRLNHETEIYLAGKSLMPASGDSPSREASAGEEGDFKTLEATSSGGEPTLNTREGTTVQGLIEHHGQRKHDQVQHGKSIAQRAAELLSNNPDSLVSVRVYPPEQDKPKASWGVGFTFRDPKTDKLIHQVVNDPRNSKANKGTTFEVDESGVLRKPQLNGGFPVEGADREVVRRWGEEILKLKVNYAKKGQGLPATVSIPALPFDPETRQVRDMGTVEYIPVVTKVPIPKASTKQPTETDLREEYENALKSRNHWHDKLDSATKPSSEAAYKGHLDKTEKRLKELERQLGINNETRPPPQPTSQPEAVPRKNLKGRLAELGLTNPTVNPPAASAPSLTQASRGEVGGQGKIEEQILSTETVRTDKGAEITVTTSRDGNGNLRIKAKTSDGGDAADYTLTAQHGRPGEPTVYSGDMVVLEGQRGLGISGSLLDKGMEALQRTANDTDQAVVDIEAFRPMGDERLRGRLERSGYKSQLGGPVIQKTYTPAGLLPENLGPRNIIKITKEMSTLDDINQGCETINKLFPGQPTISEHERAHAEGLIRNGVPCSFEAVTRSDGQIFVVTVPNEEAFNRLSPLGRLDIYSAPKAVSGLPLSEVDHNLIRGGKEVEIAGQRIFLENLSQKMSEALAAGDNDKYNKLLEVFLRGTEQLQGLEKKYPTPPAPNPNGVTTSVTKTKPNVGELTSEQAKGFAGLTQEQVAKLKGEVQRVAPIANAAVGQTKVYVDETGTPRVYHEGGLNLPTNPRVADPVTETLNAEETQRLAKEAYRKQLELETKQERETQEKAAEFRRKHPDFVAGLEAAKASAKTVAGQAKEVASYLQDFARRHEKLTAAGIVGAGTLALGPLPILTAFVGKRVADAVYDLYHPTTPGGLQRLQKIEGATEKMGRAIEGAVSPEEWGRAAVNTLVTTGKLGAVLAPIVIAGAKSAGQATAHVAREIGDVGGEGQRAHEEVLRQIAEENAVNAASEAQWQRGQDEANAAREAAAAQRKRDEWEREQVQERIKEEERQERRAKQERERQAEEEVQVAAKQGNRDSGKERRPDEQLSQGKPQQAPEQKNSPQPGQALPQNQGGGSKQEYRTPNTGEDTRLPGPEPQHGRKPGSSEGGFLRGLGGALAGAAGAVALTGTMGGGGQQGQRDQENSSKMEPELPNIHEPTKGAIPGLIPSNERHFGPPKQPSAPPSNVEELRAKVRAAVDDDLVDALHQDPSLSAKAKAIQKGLEDDLRRTDVEIGKAEEVGRQSGPQGKKSALLSFIGGQVDETVNHIRKQATLLKEELSRGTPKLPPAQSDMKPRKKYEDQSKYGKGIF